jgi:amino acid transporter
MDMDMDKDTTQYKKNSLSLWGAISMGTGVMIGAGIFAITGQMAELTGKWFPAAFTMFFEKTYGKSTMTAACALLIVRRNE